MNPNIHTTTIEETKEEVNHLKEVKCAKNDVPSKCGTCSSHLKIGGPIWSEKIHNIDFVKAMYE